MRKIAGLLFLSMVIIGISTAVARPAGPSQPVFAVREVTVPFPDCETTYPTYMACVEDQLATQQGLTVTRRVINMTDRTVFANPERFAYDTFPDPTRFDLFALEILGRIVVKPEDLTTTFAVGSDDGFLLEIEGGSFISSAQTIPWCCGGSTTISGNQMTFNGLRAYAESYGVFRFDKPGVHLVRLIYLEWGGDGFVNFSSARGDQLQGLGPAIYPPNPFPGTFSLINDPDSDGIQLLPLGSGK